MDKSKNSENSEYSLEDIKTKFTNIINILNKYKLNGYIGGFCIFFFLYLLISTPKLLNANYQNPLSKFSELMNQRLWVLYFFDVLSVVGFISFIIFLNKKKFSKYYILLFLPSSIL